MATLTVLKFHTATGANEMLAKVEEMAKQQLVRIHDGAIVEWDPGDKKPKTRQLNNLTAAGAWGGAFWGLLFGLIFLVPILGAAIGAGLGALTGSLTDVGISNQFIEEVRAKITPGTSALFLQTSDAVTDRVVHELKDFDFELIASNLSTEQEDALREAFAEERAEG